MPNIIYELANSIGIEFETTRTYSFNRNGGNGNRGGNPVLRGIETLMRGTHDASIESTGYSISTKSGNFPITFDSPETEKAIGKLFQQRVFGEEFVSFPMNETSEIFRMIRILTENLLRNGEPQRDNRAGIHIHVGMGINLNILRNITKLTLGTESLLFHLAGLNYPFRGLSNSSAYCRPFTKFGPPIVVRGDGSKISQLFKANSLLEAKSCESFFNRFGGTQYRLGDGRYVPIRYMFVNVYSLLLHQTLEFRMWNKTLDPFLIMAVIQFCRGFTNYCLNSRIKDFPVMSIYEEHSKYEHHDLLSTLSEEFDLSVKTRKILHDIIDDRDSFILPEEYVATHLSEGSYPAINFQNESGFEAPEILNPNKIKIIKPKVVVNNHNAEARIGFEAPPQIIREPRPVRNNQPRFIVENVENDEPPQIDNQVFHANFDFENAELDFQRRLREAENNNQNNGEIE